MLKERRGEEQFASKSTSIGMRIHGARGVRRTLIYPQMWGQQGPSAAEAEDSSNRLLRNRSR